MNLKNKPFLLRPQGKDYLWGGNRLNEDFGKNIDLSPLAETWECSTHPDGPSIIASGEYEGLLLSDVIKTHPEFLGTNHIEETELPILIKFIDAKKDLSVQVHPSDEYAKRYENGSLGKSEMWYLLDATEDASLVYGVKESTSPEILKKKIEDGTVEELLHKVPVKKGDAFFIPAGTIHAIGKGSLIAEIQENSNLTYRLYDYNRTDKFGKKRPLHIDKSLDVANLNPINTKESSIKNWVYKKGSVEELLYRCKYFETHVLKINTEISRNLYDLQSTELSFITLLCIDGCGTLKFEEEQLDVFKGDCIFIPADSVNMKLHGKMEFLKVEC